MSAASSLRLWSIRLAGAVLALLAAVVLAAWLVVRASLPSLDGVYAVSGLSADASIGRDDHGIPTIRAADRQDLAFVDLEADILERLHPAERQADVVDMQQDVADLLLRMAHARRGLSSPS